MKGWDGYEKSENIYSRQYAIMCESYWSQFTECGGGKKRVDFEAWM